MCKHFKLIASQSCEILFFLLILHLIPDAKSSEATPLMSTMTNGFPTRY